MSTQAARSVTRVALLLGLLCGAGLWLVQERVKGGMPALLTPKATPSAPSRILIVLDTFRIDLASVCGGPVPTPNLEALAQDAGGVFSCEAVTPGAWTLPSHASYFTGVSVLEHGSHSDLGGESLVASQRILPLDARLPTLAERYTQRGYQTLLVSGNPVVGELTGLARGFEHQHTAQHFGLNGEAWRDALERELLTLDRERPLFVFLNISDAHAPWAASPSGLSWVAPAQALDPYIEEWYAVPLEQQPAELTRRTQVYMWAIHRADRTLGLALDELQARGWYVPERDRLVVTTDHGEVLGEEGEMGHGGTLLESNVRALLYAHGADVDKLPAPISALEAHALVLDGGLRGYPVQSLAMPFYSTVQATGGRLGTKTWLGVWQGGEKWIWRDGVVEHRDLALGGPRVLVQDPGPLAPLIAELQAYEPQDQALDPELEAMLRAAGYIGD